MPIVTFSPADGPNAPVPTTKEVTVGEPYGTLATATRPGYTLTGWNTTYYGVGGSWVTSETTVTNSSDHTLYAIWSMNTQYTITFKAWDEGAVLETRDIPLGALYGTMPDSVARPGYTFVYWMTLHYVWDGSSMVLTATQIDAETETWREEDHDVFGFYEANEYTVTFDSQGGSAESPITVTYDAAYGTLPTPTRSQHTFDGWFTAAEGGDEVTAETVVSTADDHTLYAHWTPFGEFAGGDGTEGNPYQITTPQMLQDVKNDRSAHYEIMNDLDMSAFGAFAALSGAGINTFLGTLDGGGNTISGMTCTNWFFQQVGGALGSPGYIRNLTITDSTMLGGFGAIAGDMTQGGIENCHVVNCTVSGTRDVGGLVGKVGIPDNTNFVATVTKSSVTGCTVYTTGDTSSQGYQVGCFASIVYNGGSITECFAKDSTAAHSRTIYASVGGFAYRVYGGYIHNCYADNCDAIRTVGTATSLAGFVADVSQGTAPNVSWCYSTGKVIYQADPQPTDKGFINTVTSPGTLVAGYWDKETSLQATSAYGTGLTTVQAKQQAFYTGFDFDTVWEIDETADYPRLQWESPTVTITFDSQGGTAQATKTVMFEGVYGTLPTPLLAGSVFAGWFTESTGGSQVTATSTVTVQNNHTLYAQWSTGGYTVGPPVSRSGLRAVILNNPDITTAGTLKTWANSRLSVLQFPAVDYEIEAADLSRAGNRDHEQIVLGEVGHLVDKDLAINTTVTLQEIHRSLDNPLDVQLMFRSTQRRIDDRVSEMAKRLEDYSGPTEYMDPENIPIDDGVTLEDWVGPDGTIDGGRIADGTIDRLELARIISRTSESPQEYTVELLDPETRAPTGTNLTGCLTASNDSELLPNLTNVLVLIRSNDQAANGEKNVIIDAVGGAGGGGDVYYIVGTTLTFTGTSF